MNVLFGNKSVDCRHLETRAGRVRIGDFIKIGNVLFKVETQQKDCPSIENLSHVFTQWVLSDATGQKHYTRSIFGTVEVFRPTTQKVA